VSNKVKNKNGFSLIELLVVIGISSIILSFVFYLFNNVNYLTGFIRIKDKKSIELSYTINQLRDDVLHIIPGRVSNSSGFQLIDGEKLIFHRLSWNIMGDRQTKKITKVTWKISGDKLFRQTNELGESDNKLDKMVFETNNLNLSFSVITNDKNQLNFSSDVNLNLPEGINLFAGGKQIQLFTSRVAQP